MVNIIYGNKTKLHYGIESETNRGSWISFPGSRNEFLRSTIAFQRLKRKSRGMNGIVYQSPEK